jgi:hypothetical protein
MPKNRISLIVSTEVAEKQLRSILHPICLQGITTRWRVNKDGTVPAQSVCWLFCWAKTGQRSEQARLASIRALDHILSKNFKELDAVLDHEYARKVRYFSLKRDIEEEFQRRITPP